MVFRVNEQHGTPLMLLFLNVKPNKMTTKATTPKLYIFESSFIQSDHIYRYVQETMDYISSVTQQLPIFFNRSQTVLKIAKSYRSSHSFP